MFRRALHSPLPQHEEKSPGRFRRRSFSLFIWGLLAAAALFTAMTARAWALPEDLRFQSVSREAGFSLADVLCTAQDGQGFLWFGTRDGLNRYDGYEFKVLRMTPGTKDSLAGDTIRALLADKDGTLWLGLEGAGLQRYERSSGKFKTYVHDPEDPSSLSSNDVLTLFQDSKGVLWVGTAEGLDAMTPEGAFVRYQHEPSKPDSLIGHAVRAIAEDRQGRLWVGTEAGLNRMEPDVAGFSPPLLLSEAPESLARGGVSSLLPEPGGVLWVGYDKAGLARLEMDSGRVTYFFKDTPVKSLFKDSRGILWVGTEYGLGRRVFRRSPLSGDLREHFIVYRHNPFDPTSLGNDNVSCVMEDASGLLWIGTRGQGIAKLNPVFQEFRLLHREPWNPLNPFAQPVSAVVQDKNGVLWCGSSNGGLSRVDLSSGEATALKQDSRAPGSFPTSKIRALALDPKGSLWVGSADAGLILLDPKDRSFRQYRHDPENSNSLGGNDIRALYDDGKGSLWVGLDKAGLNRLDKSTGRVTRYRAASGAISAAGALGDDHVRTILEFEGSLWLGTDKGLDRYDLLSERFTHWRHDPKDLTTIVDNRVTALLPGPTKNTLWVGTARGLDLFDIKTETFKHFNKGSGYDFAGESVAGMLRGNQGCLWISTQAGLSRFDPLSGKIRNFFPDDGLQGAIFLDNSAWSNSRGELFFGGVNGLTWFGPERIGENTHVPPVVLTDLRIMHKPLAANGDISALKFFELRHTDKVVSFTFAALDFSDPKRNSYAYMLEGFDKNWVEAGGTRTATYTNLGSGTYVFRVRAANNDGVWNMNGLHLGFEVMPPFWGQPWFLALATIAVLAAFWWLYWLHTNRMRKHHQLLESQVAEQTGELERAYSQLMAIMNYSPTAIGLKDRQGRYTLVNPQFSEFFKVHQEAARLKTEIQVFEPETAALLNEADQEVWHTGRDRTFELRFGESTFVMQRFALRDEQSKPYAICGIATDISERKGAEDALKASEARYRALTANFPEGLVGLFDRELRFSLVDGAELATLGLSKQGVQGKTIYDIFPPEVCTVLGRAFREALAGRSTSLDVQYIGRDFEIRALPITNDQAQVLTGMVVARNVTARNEAEKARIESEQIYRSIAELSPDAMFVHDSLGVLFANGAAAAMLGVESVRELMGRSMLSFVQDKDRPVLRELFALARESRRPTHLVEVQLQAADGSLLHAEMATVPITYKEGPALLTIGRDVTEQRMLMAETMRSAQLASLGELAAGVAHEINNPINGIINFAELIRDDPEKRLTYADLPERIIKEGERIAVIVRTLLSFSKGQEEDVTIASLEDVLTDAMHLCRNQLEKDGIRIVIDAPGGIPKVHGRPNELQQVCINLISNARAAINARHGDDPDAKRLEIALGVARWQDKDVVRMIFTDNGVGIDRQIMEHIFEPFFSTKPRNEGTGLGLSISHRIVHDHHGRIYYESTPGELTRAIVEVPAWTPPEEKAETRGE